MNEEKLKLARKYFIQQKKEEIAIFLKAAGFVFLGVIIFIVVPYYLGSLIAYFFPSTMNNIDAELFGVSKWLLGMIPTMTIAGLYSWLNENWKRAKKRAGLK